MGLHPLHQPAPTATEFPIPAEVQAAEAKRKADEAKAAQAIIDALAEPNTNAEPNTTAANESPNTSDGNPSVPDFTTNHGSLERPLRSASAKAWHEYAAADPQGAPDGHATMTGAQLADLYLGPAA